MQRDGLLQYNKNTSDKRRPTIMISPQERQRKAAADALADPIIKELSEKLSELADDMLLLKSGNSVAVVGTSSKFYSEEEFNDELTKALKKELESLPKQVKMSTDNVELEAELVDLKKQLEIKDGIISALKTLEIKATGMSGNLDTTEEQIKDPTRPSIEEGVIDPSEDSGLEAFIEIDSVEDTTSSRASVNDKLSKLKNLLG